MKSSEQEQFDGLDNESKHFIGWNFDRIESDVALETLIYEVTDRARQWLFDHRSELRDRLMAKMIKGAQEHGAPIHPIERVERELEGEYLDLIGWTQVLKYNQHRLTE